MSTVGPKSPFVDCQQSTSRAKPNGRAMWAVLLLVILSTSGRVKSWQPGPPDQDGDGLPDAWEIQFGLDPTSSVGLDGAAGDPDGDDVSNLLEFAAGTHPRGLRRQYLAEGSTAQFFGTVFDLANASQKVAHVQLRYLPESGHVTSQVVSMPPMSSYHIDASTQLPIRTDFATVVESDVDISVDRRMSWPADHPYGAHAETGIDTPSTTWYFAEGATHSGFQLFYLLENPTDRDADVMARYLLPADSPVEQRFVVPARARYTIWANQLPSLEATDVAAAFTVTNDVPIVAERTMYRSSATRVYDAGHGSMGSRSAATTWHFAEGATGSFFDMFLLLANPGADPASVRLTYALDTGETLVRDLVVSPRSRVTVWVDREEIDGSTRLADASLSVTVASTNGVGVVAERAMWWPGPTSETWYEAHVSSGASHAGIRWVVAGGRVAPAPDRVDQYVLVLNTAPTEARLRVTLLLEGQGVNPSLTTTSLPHSRVSFDIGALFSANTSRTFGVLVESLGDQPAPIVVESSQYIDGQGAPWLAGTNSFGHEIPVPLLDLPDQAMTADSSPVTLPVVDPSSAFGPFTLTAVSDAPGVGVSVNPTTGVLVVSPTSYGASSATVTVTLSSDAGSYSRSVRVNISPSASFSAGTRGPYQLFPAVADLNGDGWPEYLGTLNDGAGHLVASDAVRAGFGALLQVDPFIRRDIRIADFNGDRIPDFVTNVYTSATDTTVAAALFLGNGNGTFREDPTFRALGIRGFGETIVAADFDNDGDIDLFLPHYTHNSPIEHNYLLVNDGTGHFTDRADAAGVAMRSWTEAYKVEGTQALDFDDDGWLDLYVGSHLFINNHNLTFTDRRASLGLPLAFDEGAKFLDWNNDGRLDLLLMNPSFGPSLFEFDGSSFHGVAAFQPLEYVSANGVNVADVNADGLEDVITSGGFTYNTKVFLNDGSRFVRRQPTSLDALGNDCLAFGDFNRDGRLDLVKRLSTTDWFANTAPLGSSRWLSLEIVGNAGEHNQYGRVVRIRPTAHPSTVYTRVVDGGSGYLSQGQYDVLVGTPYDEPHRVTVRFDNRTVDAVVLPGQRVRVYRTGHVLVLP